jgi:DNA-binding IclR family transcriptional regulator
MQRSPSAGSLDEKLAASAFHLGGHLCMTETGSSDPLAAVESSGVAVLDRAFSLLAAFDQTNERMTLTDLANRTGLYKSTVLRLLAALEHGGFIRKLADGRYSIGPQPLRLATVYQGSFRVGHVIEPLLKQLSASCAETASYYVRHGEMRIALFRAEPTRGVRAAVSVGSEYPIGQGASGKVLLAFSRRSGARSEARHRQIREQLWAVSYGERDPDTASVSAPVFDVTGEMQGAFAVSGPKQRLMPPKAMLAACRHLLESARTATTALGGDGGVYGQPLDRLSLDKFRSA